MYLGLDLRGNVDVGPEPADDIARGVADWENAGQEGTENAIVAAEWEGQFHRLAGCEHSGPLCADS